VLRRIAKEQVCLGMHVHSLEGAWLSHPFWRTKFVLDDDADVEALRQSDIDAVVIDDEKGLSPPHSAEPQTESAIAESPLPQAPSPRRNAGTRPRPSQPLPQQPSATSEEIDRAARVVSRSKRVVTQLMNQARLGQAVDSALVLPVVEDITASVDRNPSALVCITRVRTKDEYTYVHSIAVCALMVNLARQLGLDDASVRELGAAGLLHDFGKVAVPDAVLKKPGALTEQEFSIIRRHPERGTELLRSGGYSDLVLDVCLHHHEKFDGSGYPHGLAGTEISLHARMGAVCDVYDAITSRRPYKEASGPAESLARMYGWKGHFDPEVLEAFIKSIGIFPVGSLVRMNSDKLGMVVDRGRDDSTRPIVRVFYCIRDRVRISPYDVDLARSQEDGIFSREEPARWGFTAWDEQWPALIRGGPGSAARAA
jgi:putative nucleotidyltransferase with HDIG domain